MKILQLCKKFPYPLKDGETIAVTYLSKALHNLGCEMTLLCMNTTKHYTDVSKIPENFDHYKDIHFTELDNKIKPLDAFTNLFSKESYHVSRFICKEYELKLIQLLESKEFDVVQLETLYLAPYVDIIRKHSKALITMRAHNVEHEIWERISANTTFLPKKWYLSYLTKKLKRFELENLNEYDYLIAVTDKDLKTFKNLGYKNGAIASPIGIDISSYKPKHIIEKEKLNLCFIGSLDWVPNVEGLEWFLKNVWPDLNAKFPDITLDVAGRNTPNSILNMKHKNVNILGEIPSAIKFIRDHAIMIVPLFSGSGMRVKILEGMALGKIIITTSLGLEGIHAEHQKEVLIADDPQEFIECIQYCYENPARLEQISFNASEFVKNYFDNKLNAESLLETYEKLMLSPYKR